MVSVIVPDSPAIIHTHIERDRRKLWHPVLELRHRGRVIYALTFVKGYVMRGKAADVAAQEMVHVERLASRG